MNTCVGCIIVVILIEGFHLTAACWGMLGGRNKELNKLCSGPPFFHHMRACKCESRSTPTSRCFVVFVLFCLFHKWWSFRQERERHSTLPGGKVLAAGHRPLSIPHPPPPAQAPHDWACACVWLKEKRCIQKCVSQFRGFLAFRVVFFFLWHPWGIQYISHYSV